MIKFIKRYKWRILITTLALPVVMFVIWREYRVWVIPDIGEPFDVQAFLEPYEDPNQNGYVDFLEAEKLYVHWDMLKKNREHTGFDPNHDWYSWEQKVVREAMSDWDSAHPLEKNYLAENQAALEKYFAGTQKRFVLDSAPGDIGEQLDLVDLENERLWVSGRMPQVLMGGWNLSMLQASKLTSEGNYDDAWKYHKSLIQEEIQDAHSNFNGFSHNSDRRKSKYLPNRRFLDSFLAHENLTAEQLRSYLHELQEAYDAIPAPSTQYKWSYFYDRDQLKLNSPNPITPVIKATYEDQQLQYLVSLWTHAQIQSCDLPNPKRPELRKVIFPENRVWNYLFYTVQRELTYYPFEGTHEQNGVLYSEEDLFSAYNSLLVDDVFGFKMPLYDLIGQEELRTNIQMDMLMVALQCYYRDQGKFPEQQQALVPDYVKQLPLDLYNGKPLGYGQTEGQTWIKCQESILPRKVIEPSMKYERHPAEAEKL